MARKSNRNFFGLLSGVGVDDADRQPEISEDVQLVYIADDLRRLIAPRSPVEGFTTQGVPVDAIRVSGISFRPPPDSAAIITWMRNDSAIDTLYIVGTTLDLTNNLNPGTEEFSTGPGSPRSTFQFGSKAVQTAGVLLPAGENIPDRHPDIVIEPGQIFLWVGVTINTAAELTWSWREVPV